MFPRRKARQVKEAQMLRRPQSGKRNTVAKKKKKAGQEGAGRFAFHMYLLYFYWYLNQCLRLFCIRQFYISYVDAYLYLGI